MIAYRSLFSMGTRLEMLFPGLEEDTADKLFLKVKESISDIENTLSIYRHDSEFSLMNLNAHKTWFKLNQTTFDLLQDLLRYNKLTLGYFDPTLGILKSDVYGRNAGSIKELLKYTMEERLEFIPEESSVKYKSSLVKFDSGAFGKGYALESVNMILLSYKIENAFISFGDSSVMTIGKHPAGSCWKVGIRDLVKDDQNAWVFELNDGSVSTSGNTIQNSIKTNSGHLVNPLSGESINFTGEVSVMGESAMITEILSTALFIANREKRIEILKNFPQYKAIELVYNEEKKITETHLI